MKLTTLIENTKLDNPPGLIGEHGLSIHVNRNNQKILFDTGTTNNFLHNAKLLGVDIKDVDIAILSHGHLDHGGGLLKFLEENDKAKVYMKKTADKDYYLKILFLIRHIGLNRKIFDSHLDRIVFIDEFAEISKDFFLLTDIKESFPKPKGNKYLYKMENNSLINDDFAHELIMVIKENNSLIVFTGCSHNGILNMIDTVRSRFPDIPIKSVLGGFHMVGIPKLNTMAGSANEIENVGKELMKFNIEKTYTGHCTGKKAFNILKKIMGDKLEYFATGSIINL